MPTHRPICERPDFSVLGPVEGGDASVVQCPRCGTYAIDALAPSAIQHGFNDRRHLLTAATRAASDAEQRAFVEEGTLETLVSSVPPRGTLLEMVDRLLLFIAQRVPDYWEAARFDPQVDYPLIAAKNPEEFTYLSQIAIDRDWVDSMKPGLTPAGWDRVESYRKVRPTSQQAFVAMWFDPSLDGSWLHGFKVGIEDTKRFLPLRMDGLEFNDRIDDRIVAEIRRSSLLVADFTGNRGGVYFEAGLALGLGIPVIWTCRRDYLAQVHFDTRQYNHIVWETAADLRIRLRDRIGATMPQRLV